MMAPKGSEIDIAIFIFITLLTDFVTFNKFCVLLPKYHSFFSATSPQENYLSRFILLVAMLLQLQHYHYN